jgi:hypothetical protein
VNPSGREKAERIKRESRMGWAVAHGVGSGGALRK